MEFVPVCSSKFGVKKNKITLWVSNVIQSRLKINSFNFPVIVVNRIQGFLNLLFKSMYLLCIYLCTYVCMYLLFKHMSSLFGIGGSGLTWFEPKSVTVRYWLPAGVFM